MQPDNDGHPYTITRDDSYCPDYTNRKNENQKGHYLNDHIKKLEEKKQ